MSPRKTSKGPKPNPLTQSNRVRKNGEAQFERIQTILNQERSGRQSLRVFPPKVAKKINALSSHQRHERVKAEINALLKKRRRNETNHSPTHTDYSTNSDSEEPVSPPKKSFREEYKNQPNVKKTNSEMFRVTRKVLGNRSRERNEETKKRHPKRAKTQSAPKPEVGPLGKIKNLWEKVMDEISKLKGT
jgi:hypothetical protein